MKPRTPSRAPRPKLNPYELLIQKATGAPVADLPRIENIMSEEIFHSTLDWQTRPQLIAAAREAYRLLNEDRPLRDLDRACRLAMTRKMRAEAALEAADTPTNRAAATAADTAYEEAKARLFAALAADPC